LNFGRELKLRGVITSFHRKNIHSLPLTPPLKPDLNANVAFELLITPNGGYMLKDTDFEFPNREYKLDRVWVEWNNLTNDKEKRRYCNELEEVIKKLEDELDSKNKEVNKLSNIRKQLGGYLAVSIIILILGVCGIFVLH